MCKYSKLSDYDNKSLERILAFINDKIIFLLNTLSFKLFCDIQQSSYYLESMFHGKDFTDQTLLAFFLSLQGNFMLFYMVCIRSVYNSTVSSIICKNHTNTKYSCTSMKNKGGKVLCV